ncbi:hypothetical protein [Sinosporangium siamense]|uniref:Uncharacterized protein n=1 Tax=Sinosporangium siamense TaxID=1367973 RepID=A0A919RJ96_9ACTN|nr:hypothetical protein [Sinosporangium siamense]GII94658.1 hypothetical protein Ssi02_48890 [Sinosporangium siamense]
MSWHWFPDNTVLCNFATVSRLPLLEQVLRGRGRWVEAIALEAEKSSRYLPQLTTLAQAGWLGDPIEIDDPDEIDRVERIRRAVFGGLREEPLKHLGEAQTCHVILTWEEFKGSYWISDDRDALEYARAQGVPTRDTADLISEAVMEGCCTREEGFQLLLRMREANRHVRLPGHPCQL